MLCVIGNVGTVRGNLTLIPGASPDDGLLDLYIASPRRFRHWVKLALRLITRRPKKDDQVDQRKGKRVHIMIDGKDNYQLDGDVVGESTILDAKIQPGSASQPGPPASRNCDPAQPSAGSNPAATASQKGKSHYSRRKQHRGGAK
jgi:diacylglycerol kinase (ATP)